MMDTYQSAPVISLENVVTESVNAYERGYSRGVGDWLRVLEQKYINAENHEQRTVLYECAELMASMNAIRFDWGQP